MKFHRDPERVLSGRVCLLASLALLTLAACGEDPAEPEDGEEPAEFGVDEEGCEHMSEGPSTSVTAGADAASASDATAEHTRVDIAFVDVEGGRGGSVTYAAEADGDHAIFLDADIPFTITDAGGAAVEIEASEAVALCAEVAIKHTVEFEVGLFTLTFAGGEAAGVGMVIEADTGGEHDEDHDE